MRNCENGVHRTAVVILAAGLSRRFGGNKLQSDIGGKPLILATMNSATESNAKAVIVVVNSSLLRAHLPVPSSVRLLINRFPERGIASSIKLGIRSLDEETCSCILQAGDQPLVTSDMLNSLMKLHASDPARIVAFRHEGKARNPALFPRSCFDELLQLNGDSGAQRLIMSRSSDVLYLDIDDDSQLMDIDTKDDLDAFWGLLHRR